MRIESSVTSISWIPSEAVKGLPKMPFEVSVAHYDQAPPEHIDDIEQLQREGRFRFANELRAWIEVEDGRIVDHGQSGGGHMGSTTAKLGPRPVVFPPVAFPEIRPEPQVSDTQVTFFQTAGGRSGIPAPRRVRRKPFVQLSAPLVWSTLALTISADGSSQFQVVGASGFPRHWIYDQEGRLVAKSGLMDFDEWYRTAFGAHSPWGDEDSPAFVTMAESALERQLSATIMRGDLKPKLRRLREGETLVEQGQPGTDLYLLLDGVLTVEVDGEELAEIGPGAVLGERAVLEGGLRTSTLRAVTACRVAAVPGDQIDRAALAEVVLGHQREEKR